MVFLLCDPESLTMLWHQRERQDHTLVHGIGVKLLDAMEEYVHCAMEAGVQALGLQNTSECLYPQHSREAKLVDINRLIRRLRT